MSEPTLTISIDRTPLEKAPLVLSGVDGDGNPIGVMNFQEPGLIPRVTYAPSPVYTHGEVPLAWSYQQGLLSWDSFPDATTEAAAEFLYGELVEALTQWPSFPVTIVQSGVTKLWTCHVGSVQPEARTRANLTDHDTVWAVSVPCYPTPVVS